MFFKKTDEEKYIDFLNKFRKDHIPKRFNQIKLCDELLNDQIDHYISISNRSDGKTFNYLHFFIHFSIEFDIPFLLICRRYTVRMGYQRQIIKILEKSKIYDEKEFIFSRGDFYTQIFKKEKVVGLITDLNQATDLKYHSNFLEDFPILIYDEFLALESDYLIDEWERLKTIYSSVNRKEHVPLIKFPKIFYLGNAVNFSSPILANLNIFNILEKHPINTQRQYDNIYLEMVRNDNANEERNLRAFKEEKDKMTMGQFQTNSYFIADENVINQLKKNQFVINVKLVNEYLQIKFNPDNGIIVLGITSYVDDYQFNYRLNDNKEGSEFLKESYFNERNIKKYDSGRFYFTNNYSRDVILSYSDFKYIDIFKIIRRYNYMIKDVSNFEIKEFQYKQNYIEQSKRNLVKKFLRGS